MKTPFEILEVPEDADDQQIKKAYLAAVHRFPPDRYPERFKKIRGAYERIATEKDRLAYLLFDTSLPDPGEIAVFLLKNRIQRMQQERLPDLLRLGVETCRTRFDLRTEPDHG